MKRILLAYIVLAASVFVEAKIVELKSLKDLDLKQIDAKTLVVFDIDNTLLRQDSMIGTHQWGDFLAERATRAGIDLKVAKESQYKAFADVQAAVKVVPVEAEALDVLNQLSKSGISHFALTARNAKLKEITIKQLQALKHDFAKSFPKLKKMGVIKEHLKQGVIFANSTPKGELLKKIVDQSEQKYKRIIFVDDKLYNLESVEKSMDDQSIELISYRYAAADSFVNGFDPVLADVVYTIFKINGTLISDEAARATMAHTEEKKSTNK